MEENNIVSNNKDINYDLVSKLQVKKNKLRTKSNT